MKTISVICLTAQALFMVPGCNQTNQDNFICEQKPMVLWYDEPAISYMDTTNSEWAFDWFKALPIGNGRMGAMLFGGIEKDKIQLNEESLWGGYKRDRNNPNALNALPEIQQLLFDNKADEALKLAYENISGIPRKIKSYQTLCDVEIEYAGLNKKTHMSSYHRELNLDSAISETHFINNGKTYVREAFASYPDNVVVYKMSCDKPKSINAKIFLKREKDATVRVSVADSTLYILEGQINEQHPKTGKNVGMKFLNYVKVIPKGGTQEKSSEYLHFKNADEIVILITAATNYAGRTPKEICDKNIQNALKYSYDELKERHITDFQKYYNRVKISLGNNNSPYEHTTDERIKMVKSGFDDNYLSELFFQYGRYLLISHSRPGDLPGNLTGIWWGTTQAPWNGDYHININCQMNYWLAQNTNLAEMNTPFFDLVDSIAVSGKNTAKKTYGADGWVAHHLTDVFWTTAPADWGAGLWPFGGVWSVRQLYEHYLYNNDKEFLEHRAYPLMKGAAEFVIDFLVEIPEGLPFEGKLVTNPSHSPENAFEFSNGKQSQFTYGATMDLMLIHDLFNNCIEAIDALELENSTEKEFRSHLEETLAKLVPVQVNEKGRIQEWIEDYKETEIGHRHLSHLYSLYPANDISLHQNPDLANAAQKTLKRRVHGNPNAIHDESDNKFGSFDSFINKKGGAGWSHAHAMNLWARLEHGNEAYHHYKYIMGSLTFPNLLGQAHRTYCIDCNHGGSAGVAEMLVQSHEGFIRLLPSLPNTWEQGKVSGLRARNGFEVSLEWKHNKLVKAYIQSVNGNTCSVYANKVPRVTLNNTEIEVSKTDDNVFTFNTEIDNLYEIFF